MSIEQPNPYTAPASIAHNTERRSSLANFVMAVCLILTFGMLVGQQIARIRFEVYGIELPVLTNLLLNPLAVCLPLLLCIPPVWVARSRSNRWTISICILALVFMLFWAAVFCLAMYLPDLAIRNGLGI
jgi:hypothetical protein